MRLSLIHIFATIFLIVLSSVFCPIFLKLVFKNQHQPPVSGAGHKTTISSEAIDNVMDGDVTAIVSSAPEQKTSGSGQQPAYQV